MIPDQAKAMKAMMGNPAGFLDTKPAQAVTRLLAEQEAQLQEAVAALVDAHELDREADVVDAEDRAQRLRAGLKAVITGEIPQMWVLHYADVEEAEEAAQFAGLDDETWAETTTEWAAKWRAAGVEGADDELIEAHIRSRFGVTRERFEALVVEWDTDREQTALRQVLAGPVDTATEQIEAAAEAARER